MYRICAYLYRLVSIPIAIVIINSRRVKQIYFDTLAFLPTATPECNATIRRNADALLLFHERLSRRLNEIDDRIHWRADHLSSNGAWDDDKVLTALEEVSNIIQSEVNNPV